MGYPSEDDVLRCESVLDWIDDHFLRSDPYAFKDAPNGFQTTAALISRELDVDRNGIFCIGSGAVGLSLNPAKSDGQHLKKFDGGSDIDLAVISDVHFETAWRDLRKAAQSTTQYLDEAVREHIAWQKKRFFDGAILANKLLPALSFGPTWTVAVVRVSQHVAELLGREIELEICIYRDYWSLRNNVSDGLVRCRRKTV